jgi:predicted dehydrogenase
MIHGSTMSKRRFLIIGCGSIGKRHLGNLLAARYGDVIAFDVSADRAADVRSRFGVDAYSDLDRALNRGPQVALITAPTSLHVPLAQQAAERGCHLFIEKPLSHSRDGVETLLERVCRDDRITLVGCNLRFHPGLIIVKRLLEEGAVGRVVAARVEVGHYLPDWHPAEDYRQGYSARTDLGGGIILDAVHEIDYIRWLLGPIRSVACFAEKLSHLEIQTEDTAALLFRFMDGAIGEVHLDYVQRAYSRTCHIIGDAGTIRWDYTSGEVRTYTASSHAWSTVANPAGWQPNQMYVDELAHFARCLDGDERPALDVSDAARVLDVALAAKESSRAGRVITFEGGM